MWVTVGTLRRFIKIFSLFGVLAAALLLLLALDPSVETYTRFVDENIREHGSAGVGMYIALVAVLSCLAVPRQLLSFVGGYAFGAVAGALWATVGTTLGCIMAFGYARLLGQRFVQKHLGRKIEKAEAFLARAPFSMAFFIRSLPVGNNLLTNLLAGLTRIPALPFFAGSALGYIAQNFIFALLGSGVRVDPFWRTVSSAVLLLLASVVGLALYKRNSKSVDEAFLESGESEEDTNPLFAPNIPNMPDTPGTHDKQEKQDTL